MKTRFLPWGAGALFLLVLAGVLFLTPVVPLASFPSEDAAILFLYSENLASYGSITYFPQQAPVEGATDFLWMALVALAHRAGIPSFLFANLLSAVALLGTALLLTRMAGEARTGTPNNQAPSSVSRLLFFSGFCAISLFLMLLPSFFAAALGFSPYFFGFFITLCVWFFLHENAWALALSALATCLIRPDGVVFAAPLYVCFLPAGQALWKKRLKAGLLGAALPGVLYFFWRWQYFGLPLPLPFYVKSYFDRFLLVFNRDSLLTNLHFSAAILPFLILAFYPSAGGMRFSRKKRMAILLSTLLVPLLFYSCMNLEQNIAFRFQYPLALIGILLGLLGFDASKRRLHLLIACAVWCIALLAPWYLTEGYRMLCTPTENMPRIAQKMGRLSRTGRIATTEAGRLPYYSHWETMDLWGLNTPDMARRIVTPDDLNAFAPDLIVLHTSGDHYGDDWRFLAATNLPIHTERNWSNMVENTWQAARESKYVLYMVPHRLPEQADAFSAWLASLRPRINQTLHRQGAFDTYYAFFIRPSSPLSAELTALTVEQGGIPYDRYCEDKKSFIADGAQASPLPSDQD